MKNYINKITKIFFVLLLIISSMTITPISAATTTTAPETLELGVAVNNGIVANQTHFPTKYLSNKIPAYCLDHHKTTAESTTVYKVGKLNYKYTVLYKNFSMIPYTGHERYFVEQLAIHWLEDRLNGISDNQAGELTKNLKNLNHEYVNWARKIVNATMNTKQVANKISVKASSSNLTKTPEGKYQYMYYETQPMTAISVGDGELISYKVSLVGAPAGTRILTMNNAAQANYQPGAQFKILVPIESVSSSVSFKVVLYGTYEQDYLYAYEPKSSTVQSITPKVLYTETTTIASTAYTLKLNYENTPDESKGNLVVVKNDTNKTALKGAVIKITDPNGNSKDYTTNANGKISLTDIETGTYTVEEVTAPTGYLLNTEEFQIEVEKDETSTLTIVNEEPTGVITLTKKDAATGSSAQGEATLEGAIYEVRAKNDIYNKSGSKLIYAKGTLVDTIETREDGSSNDVKVKALGTYTIQEVTAPTGYLLDNTVYEVTLSYANQKTNVVTTSKTVSDNVIKQAFSLTKISSETNNGANIPLQGATFTYILKEHVELYGSFDKAITAAKTSNSSILSSEWGTMTTDVNGYAVSKELPYGTYVVRETKVPENHFAVEDFEVVINKDSRTPKNLGNIIDKMLSVQVKIAKVAQETQKNILLENTTFKIKDTTTNEYVELNGIKEFTTDETGIVTLPGLLKAGTYSIEEIKAPNGYILNNEELEFTISNSMTYELENEIPTLVLKYANKAVNGQICIYKKGEVLVDYKDGQFIYEEQYLSDAVYEIIAAENIMDPSNDGTIIYNKEEIVDTVTTDANGKAISKALPLGKYKVVEKTAPNGFVLNKEEQIVELKYANQTTDLVIKESTYTNARQKAVATLVKKDADSKLPMANVQFDLYAKDDIKNIEGTVLVNANELIESVVTDENGNANFEADLPLNYDYVIKETEAPHGYASTDYEYTFNTDYQGQDIEVITLSTEFTNTIIKVEISKTDFTNGEEIAGAHLTVYPKENETNIVDSWVSGSDGNNENGTIKPHLIKGLEVGKTYVLKEVMAPYGYVIANEVEFTVEDTGEIQKVVMKDEMVFGQLTWKKTGEIFNEAVTDTTAYGEAISPVWNISNLIGAEITIYASGDITIGKHTYYKAEDKVETLVSAEEEVVSSKLPVGKYYYVETKVPHGYLADTNKHYFEVKDSKVNELQNIESTLENTRYQFEIDMTKVLEEQEVFKNIEAYKDIVFGIYAREDIKNYYDEIEIPATSLIRISGINEEGHLVNVPDLPEGKYFIKELATNNQYVLNDIEYDFEVVYKGESVAKYTIKIDDGSIENELARGSIKVYKVDKEDTAKVLSAVRFNLSVKEDMSDVLVTAKTDANGIVEFSELELGTYYLQEAEQVDGYVVNNNIYKIELIEDGSTIEIIVDNQPTEMQFSKVDFTTSVELPGATIQVTDKETGEIVDEWVSTDTPHIIKYLVEGKEYVMTETVAPEGYDVAGSITFTAKHGEKVIMKDKLIPKVPDTGDKSSIFKYVGLLTLSGFGLFVALAIKKYKEDEY